MERHSWSFFGQKVGVIVDSKTLTEPFIAFKLLKKKESGQWEKPSLREGKIIKCNLLEVIAIRQVLHTSSETAWQTMHKHHEETTSITLRRQGDQVIFQVAGYTKYFKGSELILLTDLLDHIYQEKIISATGMVTKKESSLSDLPSEDHPDHAFSASSEGSMEVSEEHEIADSLDMGINWYLSQLTTQGDFVLLPGKILSRSKSMVRITNEHFGMLAIPTLHLNLEIPHSTSGVWVQMDWLQQQAPLMNIEASG
jgi:hypothetical protein